MPARGFRSARLDCVVSRCAAAEAIPAIRGLVFGTPARRPLSTHRAGHLDAVMRAHHGPVPAVSLPWSAEHR